MKKNLFRKAALVASVGLISLAALAQQEKVIKIFDNSETPVKVYRSSDVSYIQIEDFPELSTPINFYVYSRLNSNYLAWKTVPEAMSYNIYRSSDNSNFTLLKSGVAQISQKFNQSFIDDAPLVGDNYYKVSAAIEDLTVESELTASQYAYYAPTESFTVNGVTFEMILVEGGTYKMGSDNDNSNEMPAHDETVATFYIGKSEVTQELWQAVMDSNPSSYKSETNLPVNNVSWNNCQTFISKLNSLTGKQFRLPTEPEWEYAARGGNKSQGYRWSGSNIPTEVCWYNALSGNQIHPVGSFNSNELGIFDMSGNVSEWTSDWYGNNYYVPRGQQYRVLRGGAYNSNPTDCRVSARGYNSPTYPNIAQGLRLALTE